MYAIRSYYDLCATGTTGLRINEATNLTIHRFLSGPLGGDQQIGSRIAYDKIDLVIFLRDPLTAQPHEPDVSALLRLCDVHNIPLATNLASGEVLIKGLERGDLDWRVVVNPPETAENRITSYNVCYTKLLRGNGQVFNRHF